MVYVVQEVLGKNILPAKEHGEVEVLLPPGQITFAPHSSIEILKQKLKRITSRDFLLLIGDPAAIALAAIIASEYTDGEFQFLKWDREFKTYFPIKVDIKKGEANGNK